MEEVAFLVLIQSSLEPHVESYDVVGVLRVVKQQRCVACLGWRGRYLIAIVDIHYLIGILVSSYLIGWCLVWWPGVAIAAGEELLFHFVNLLAVSAQYELGLLLYLVQYVFEAELEQFLFVGFQDVEAHFENSLPARGDEIVPELQQVVADVLNIGICMLPIVLEGGLVLSI